MTEVPKHLRKRLVPPVYMFIAIMLMTVLHRRMPLATVIGPPHIWAGAIIAALGLALSAAGIIAFRLHKTSTQPFRPSSALVQTGVYTISRNPMYLGITLILLGLGVYFGSLSALLAVPLFPLVIDRLFVRAEEQMLIETFGTAYIDYQHKVRRWI
jgi:protein-S-isoprenylcysteine O-methyltransferase Ste14